MSMKWPYIIPIILGGCTHNSNLTASHPDETEIRNRLTAVTSFVDQGCFDSLREFYADSAIFDYQSLWGTPTRTLKNEDIPAAWAGFIPGFDTTHHSLADIKVVISDLTAQATAEVDATHWLGGDVWAISGHYEVELSRRNSHSNWKIRTWTFRLSDEIGDRKLVDLAEQRAALAKPRCPFSQDVQRGRAVPNRSDQ